MENQHKTLLDVQENNPEVKNDFKKIPPHTVLGVEGVRNRLTPDNMACVQYQSTVDEALFSSN